MRKTKNEVDNGRFGRNLSYLLKGKGRGEQSRIATATEINPTQLSLIKNGQASISLSQAARVSELLNESLSDMYYVDIKARDQRLKGALLERIRISIRKVDKEEELIGSRPVLVSESVYARFEGQTYYVYYLSGVQKMELREGKLELYHRHEKSKFISGRMETNSQEYNIKIVIEEPTYVYAFGYNRNFAERLVLMLHEPKSRADEKKPYIGGIGLVIMEGSSGLPVMQKMAISAYRLPMDAVLRDFVSLTMVDDAKVELPISVDQKFYEHMKKYR